MPLIKCPMCEKDISPNAESCPNCGEPMKEKVDTEIKFKDEDVCNIVLISSGKEVIKVIKQIRDATGCSLYDAKKSVDNTPSIIIKNITYSDALNYKSSFEDLGATVEMASVNKQIDNYIDKQKLGLVIKCSNCGSTNTKKISGASKVGSAVAFGIFSVGKLTKTYQCNKCGYRW